MDARTYGTILASVSVTVSYGAFLELMTDPVSLSASGFIGTQNQVWLDSLLIDRVDAASRIPQTADGLNGVITLPSYTDVHAAAQWQSWTDHCGNCYSDG